MLPTLTLSTASLKPLSVRSAARAAWNSGFSGIEVLLGANTVHEEVREIARYFHLGLSWHEIWSLEDNGSLVNRFMASLGMVTKTTRPLIYQLPDYFEEPVVCYGQRWVEIRDMEEPTRLRLQTSRVAWDNTPWDEFVDIVREGGYRVTFDTQHALEWKLDVRNVGELGIYPPRVLNRHLMKAWEELASNVDQVHFNNFNPAWGDAFGRNVFPTDGVLDLYTFAQTVGCDLTITPEVSPAHLFPIALPHFTNIPIGLPVAPRLDALYDTVSNMFE